MSKMIMYEEFMARSSTRLALTRGGNFMGMMNVLMQLRKVCNHPDLFEPRSVITPLVLEQIVVAMPAVVLTACERASVLESVSPYLLTPIWRGSSGQATFRAALKHDRIESSELLHLEKVVEAQVRKPSDRFHRDDLAPALQELLHSLLDMEQRREIENKRFLSGVSSERCRSQPFAYPSRLTEAVALQNLTSTDVKLSALETPSHLIAMQRSHQERADDLDHIIKNFVFCVPKAGARRPILSVKSRSADMTVENILLEPCEDYFRPFRRAHARLTSFFPDKKLIQFDAGKLQALCELLRELKKGGHRCLIFTQMSRMLDILEAFLNLNGHTYVRLDGSTGVERRQRLMDRFNNDPRIFCFILSTRSGGMGINLTGADTVIFYDSDWNPAMDAQAQVKKS
jgi:helicase SWR1